MNTLILNRDFQHPADNWYQIEAKGFHPAIAHDGTKVVQVIDDQAIQSITNRFNTAAQQNDLRHGGEMLVDREHFKHDADKETTAYSWMPELLARGDGIYSRQRWTGTGQTAVDKGDYRFFSTEYEGAMEEVPPAQIPADVRNKYPGRKFVRPLELTGLSLTNMNNNRGQHPITNRETETDFATASAAAANQQPNKNKMKNIATKLGLAAEASEDALLGEVTKLQNRLRELEPLAETNTSLKNRLTELEAEQCESLMDAHGLDAEKDKTRREKLKPVLAGMKNREARVAFLKECVPVEKPQPQNPQRKLFNRDTTPPNKTGDDSEAGAKASADKIRNRALELKGAAPTRTFDDCWRQAQRENGAKN